MGCEVVVKLYHGDALEVLRSLPDASVDAVVTDPPYFRVKGEHWDRQWDSAAGFLAWLASVADEWARLLRPNGSVYCFASPDMAARVEVMLRERFNVLNRIRWVKDAGWHKKAQKEALRSYLSPWEEIIFAEHYGADYATCGVPGYGLLSEQLRGFVFQPILDYLRGEFARSGLSRRIIDAHLGASNITQYWLQERGFIIPTAENYAALRHLAPGYFLRDYEDLRADYEDLRADYEDLRRPFAVTADVPHTDVWHFEAVRPYPGKHPCEKPQELLRHIIRTSTRPGAVILDSFMGKGATGKAAAAEGRDFIGIEREPAYFNDAERRIAAAHPPLFAEVAD
jgi:site-specific DNA-methyltransferase (adenine-specific)